MRSSTSFAALAGLSAVSAQAIQGFNYGAANSDGSIKDQQRFQDEFKVAKALVGTCGWTSARLYTSIQGGTANTPIAAIPAAIAEDTTILLGIWCSAGQDVVNNEIAAIKAAIEQYGDEFTSRVTGLSVGSEDLYRTSPTGVAAESGYGASPDELVKYINQARDALKGTALENVKIGHVDTWNDWVNGSNSAVVEAVDWLGFDGYPYFQSTVENAIDNAEALFDESYAATVAAAQGKDVWVTETGWPTSGPEYGKAVASLENARKYWEKVACKLIGKVNTYWYTLQDSYPTTPSPSFGVIGTETVNTPLYDLSCPAVSCPADGESSSSSSSAAASSATASASSAESESATSAAASVTSIVDGTTTVVDGTTAVVGGSTTVVAGPQPTYGQGGNEGGEEASGTGTVTTVVGGPQPTYGEGGNGGSSVISLSGSSYIADSSVTRVISDIETIETATSVASPTAPGTGVYPPAGTGGAGGSDYGLPTGGPGGNGNYQGGNGTVVAPTAPGGASNTVSGPTSSQFLGAAKATAAPIMAAAAGGLMAVMAAF